MKTITREYKVYKFEELCEDAQQKAVERIAEFQTDYEWWDSVYEDAGTIGLKITGFDLYHHNITGKLTECAEDVAKAIKENHGKDCETYKTAEAYMVELTTMQGIHSIAAMPDEDIDTEDIDNEFEHNLLEDYRIMLQHEYEWLESKEAIMETIEANNYQFTEDGSIFS
jgi:uncharacterized protein YoaH (UPF0181 family)